MNAQLPTTRILAAFVASGLPTTAANQVQSFKTVTTTTVEVTCASEADNEGTQRLTSYLLEISGEHDKPLRVYPAGTVNWQKVDKQEKNVASAFKVAQQFLDRLDELTSAIHSLKPVKEEDPIAEGAQH